jgi:hypothetical protein
MKQKSESGQQAGMTSDWNSRALKELEDIKKLLIVQLLNSGVQAGSIARLLDMDAGNFSKMFPARELVGKRREVNK